MGIEELKSEIIAEAKKRASSLLDDARKSQQELQKRNDSQINKIRETYRDETEQICLKEEQRILSSAQLEAQRIKQMAQKDALDSVFSLVEENLTKATVTARKKFLNELLQKAKKEINVVTVSVNKNDLKLIKNAKAASIKGGLIAESKDGDVSINYSLSTLMEKTRRESLIKVQEALFE